MEDEEEMEPPEEEGEPILYKKVVRRLLLSYDFSISTRHVRGQALVVISRTPSHNQHPSTLPPY